MPLDFPNSPTNGQQYGGYTYDSTVGVWKANASAVAPTTMSGTAPANPTVGDQWFNTTDGTLYFYYYDGNTYQWVESRAPITADGYYSPNYIINGGFDFWQRGTSFTTTAAGAFTADRWLANIGAGATVATSQQTFTPGNAPVAGYEGQFFCRFNRTTTGTGGSYFTNKIEDVRTIAGKNITVSFWAKASAALTIAAGEFYFWNVYGTGGSTASGISINASAINITTSWQRFTYTVSMPNLSGKTIGANSYSELAFYFPTSSGTFTFDIWGVQVEDGAVATPFRRNANSLQGELAACQRYYWRIKSDGTNANTPIPSGGAGIGTTRAYITVTHPVAMRIPPTSLEFSGINVNTPGIEGFAITSAAIATNVSNNLITMVDCYVASGLTFRNVYRLETGSVSGYIGFSAEL